jgi:hypothetical protein
VSKLWDMFKSLVTIAIIAWAGWYGYSQLKPTPSVVDNTVEGASFNCRQALSKLAKDYACRDSASCTMTSDELTDLKNRETDIEKYCN